MNLTQVMPGLRCVLAPNPSAMTGPGTNTYLLGEGADCAVIDPGPNLDAHLQAILAVTEGRISHIIVTHAHRDHSALAPKLAQVTGAPVLAFGPAREGIRPDHARLCADLGLALGGGEGLDEDFAPTQALRDADRIEAGGWTLDVLHTPGHLPGHLCLAWGDVLFSGDHVMGWSSSLVSPPEGDMSAYVAGLHRLAERRWTRFLPGHGDPVDHPADRLAELIAHRAMREARVLATLASGAVDLAAVTAGAYPDIAPALVPAARRNALAHLIDLASQSRIHITSDPPRQPLFSLP